MILNRTIDSYHFGFSLNLTDSQLRSLTGFFHHPDSIGVSLLGGRTSVTPAKLDGIGSVVIKHYRRGGLMRYFIKHRYLKFGKTRAQREFELLVIVGSFRHKCPATHRLCPSRPSVLPGLAGHPRNPSAAVPGPLELAGRKKNPHNHASRH